MHPPKPLRRALHRLALRDRLRRYPGLPLAAQYQRTSISQISRSVTTELCVGRRALARRTVEPLAYPDGRHSLSIENLLVEHINDRCLVERVVEQLSPTIFGNSVASELLVKPMFLRRTGRSAFPIGIDGDKTPSLATVLCIDREDCNRQAAGTAVADSFPSSSPTLGKS